MLTNAWDSPEVVYRSLGHMWYTWEWSQTRVIFIFSSHFFGLGPPYAYDAPGAPNYSCITKPTRVKTQEIKHYCNNTRQQPRFSCKCSKFISRPRHPSTTRLQTHALDGGASRCRRPWRLAARPGSGGQRPPIAPPSASCSGRSDLQSRRTPPGRHA